MNLDVEIAGLRLKNPLIAASGTFGYGVENEEIVDLNAWGGIITKGLFLEPRAGCPPPRIVETPSGLLNAIGLQGVGVRNFVRDILPRLAPYDTTLIVNVCGDSVEEYAEVTRVLEGASEVDAVELNVSCPNVKQGGMAFGIDPRMLHAVVSAARKATRRPLIVKLTPNVTDITAPARVAEEAGADAVSCINTLLGMAIDVETCRPRLGFGTGGLSGPAIRPIAVRMTWQVAGAIRLPVIGVGGICCAADALEFMLAGARAVQVGTANFINPGICHEITKDLRSYLERRGLSRIDDVVGALRFPTHERAVCSSTEDAS
jgi:dihydroorotate dehydrogenase (NAD+) catalytic subunit